MKGDETALSCFTSAITMFSIVLFCSLFFGSSLIGWGSALYRVAFLVDYLLKTDYFFR